MTYELQIQALYDEYREIVKNGGTPNVEMFKRRKRALQISIEKRDKGKDPSKWRHHPYVSTGEVRL